MSDSTIAGLESSAAAGDALAMTRLGASLLSGEHDVFDPQRGAHWVETAASLGDGRACEMAAVLAGAGVCRAQCWSTALQFLRRSAEAGWKPAQEQLCLLAANLGDGRIVDAPGTDWRNLEGRVNLDAWLARPPKDSLCESPRIRKIDGFVTREVCGWLIRRAEGVLRRARTYEPDTGAPVVNAARTNSEADFNIVESDLVLILLRARIAAVTGLPPAVFELTKVLHYKPGEYFSPHHDFIDPATPGLAAEVAARGQRLVTFLIYLNDEYAGGETDFPSLGLRHRGAAGDALYFANVDERGQPEQKSLHAGLAPAAGEKWLVSQWIRNRVPEGR